MPRLTLMLSAACLALAAASAGMPFWGDDTPATNRTSAAVASASPSRGFESRICIERSQALQDFTSYKRGACIILR